MFSPIGFDFVPPIESLLDLLDRYNRTRYPVTGVWAINAGLDDYFDLVACHRDRLPTIAIDPNPYWTGFYTARPTLKQRCHELVDMLLLAERLAVLGAEQESRVSNELSPAWWDAVVANHHDFITGTSPDQIVDEEQIPWLDRATERTNRAIQRMVAPYAADSEASSQVVASGTPVWAKEEGQLEIRTSRYEIVLDEAKRGTIQHLLDRRTGRNLLEPGSNSLVAYKGSGGLWRMGHEFAGGSFREVGCTAEQPVSLTVREQEKALVITWTMSVVGEILHHTLWISEDTEILRFRVTGRAPDGHTIAVRIGTDLRVEQIAMDVPGGTAIRPRTRLYNPTYWPIYRVAHFCDADTGRGLALCQRLPGAVACRSDGDIEAIAIRNATRERAFGFVPMLGMPATGHERSIYDFDYALVWTESGDWRDNGILATARDLWPPLMEDNDVRSVYEQLSEGVTTDCPHVRVAALKYADRGEGVIVRLRRQGRASGPVTVRVKCRPVIKALECDARERDFAALAVRDGAVTLTMDRPFATVRLLF
jgi:hypothetical protein